MITRKSKHTARQGLFHCQIPDPVESAQGHERYHHLDIPYLSLEEILSERRRIQFFIDFSDRPDQWLLERLDIINQALNARQDSPEQKPETSAARHFTDRVARDKGQLYADPYFGQPEHKVKGIPVATLVHKAPSHD